MLLCARVCVSHINFSTHIELWPLHALRSCPVWMQRYMYSCYSAGCLSVQAHSFPLAFDPPALNQPHQSSSARTASAIQRQHIPNLNWLQALSHLSALANGKTLAVHGALSHRAVSALNAPFPPNSPIHTRTFPDPHAHYPLSEGSL